MKQSNLTFSQANIGIKARLPATDLKRMLHTAESDLAILPDEEKQACLRIRELAMMCGGWLEPNFDMPSEPTLREHSIL